MCRDGRLDPLHPRRMMACHHRSPKTLTGPLSLPSWRDRGQVPVHALRRAVLDDKEAYQVIADSGLQDFLPRVVEAVLHPSAIASMACLAIESTVKKIPPRGKRSPCDGLDDGAVFQLSLTDHRVLVDTRKRRDRRQNGAVDHLDEAKPVFLEQHRLAQAITGEPAGSETDVVIVQP